MVKNKYIHNLIYSFRDPNVRDEHYHKHKNEDFPFKPNNPLHYESLAQADIKNANFLTLSYAKNYVSSRNNFGLVTFHKNASTTLNIVSSSQESILHSYYVPKLTFIPEFLVFSYFCDRFRKRIFESNTDQNTTSLIFDLDKDFPASTLFRWTHDFSDSFRHTLNEKTKTKDFLKYFIKSRNNTLHSSEEYVSLNKKILITIEQFIHNNFQPMSVKQNSDFIIEIEKMILYTDEQLYMFCSKNTHEPVKDNIVRFSMIQVFSLAYLEWIYSMLLKEPRISFDFKSVNSSSDISFYYNKYKELFISINKNESFRNFCQ